MLNRRHWRDLFAQRFGGFVALSGIGWLVDFALFNVLATASGNVFGANLCGAAAGMATVFAGARLSVFRDSRRALPAAGGLYAAWSVVAIVINSLLVAALAALLRGGAGLAALQIATAYTHVPVNIAISMSAKIGATPLTIFLNFCAMTVINGHHAPDLRTDAARPGAHAGLHPDVQLCRSDRPGDPPV